MTEVVLALFGLTIPQIIQKARQWVIAMTGNPNFMAPNAVPNPTLAAVSAAATALETAFNVAEASREAAKQKTNLQNQADENLRLLLTNLGGYVQNVTAGDATKIESAGMETKKDKTPPQVPVQVSDLSATNGDFSAEVDLHWHSIKNAKGYVVEGSADPIMANSWSILMTVTKSKAEVVNQPIGAKRWYRVAAVGAAGQGPYSQPVNIIVGD